MSVAIAVLILIFSAGIMGYGYVMRELNKRIDDISTLIGMIDESAERIKKSCLQARGCVFIDIMPFHGNSQNQSAQIKRLSEFIAANRKGPSPLFYNIELNFKNDVYVIGIF